MALLAPIAGFVSTILVCPVVAYFLRRYGRTDLPFQLGPTERVGVRGGGIALIIGCAIATALTPLPERSVLGRVLLVAVVVGFVGIADDIREIGHGPKFIYEVVVLGAGSAYLRALDTHPAVWRWLLSFAIMLLAVNAFNFMDGINGVSVLTASVVGIDYAILGTIYHDGALALGSMIVVAVSLGFMPFNFPRARLFMGDAGTYFLGAWGSGLTVLGLLHGIAPLALMLPALPYGADTFTTLFRRIWRKAAWTHSHREHVYHQLVILGWSHTRTTLTITALTAFCAVVGLWGVRQPVPVQVGAVAVCLALNAVYLSLPTLLRRRQGVKGPVATPALSGR